MTKRHTGILPPHTSRAALGPKPVLPPVVPAWHPATCCSCDGPHRHFSTMHPRLPPPFTLCPPTSAWLLFLLLLLLQPIPALQGGGATAWLQPIPALWGGGRYSLSQAHTCIAGWGALM